MARTRRPLIAGNWKMNGLRADALALAKGVADGVRQAGWTDREVLVCPPATLVMMVAETVRGSGVLVGGEDCHAKASGAHTGDDLGIPPTGNAIDFESIVILRFDGGKIAEAWNYLDQLSFYQQLHILNVR